MKFDIRNRKNEELTDEEINRLAVILNDAGFLFEEVDY